VRSASLSATLVRVRTRFTRFSRSAMVERSPAPVWPPHSLLFFSCDLRTFGYATPLRDFRSTRPATLVKTDQTELTLFSYCTRAYGIQEERRPHRSLPYLWRKTGRKMRTHNRSTAHEPASRPTLEGVRQVAAHLGFCLAWALQPREGNYIAPNQDEQPQP
jgi:hypothetical protein